MSILRDEDIYGEIQEKKLISSGLSDKKVTYQYKDSAIQPSSLDLHVGDIYVPDKNLRRRYVSPTALNEHIIKPGETVVVMTQEKLDLPKYVAAIGFPPSTMSVKGILTTSPGHIDPGYKGYMHLTMINMGRQDYGLRRGDIVVTLLFFRLEKEVSVGYQKRLEEANINTNSLGEEKHIVDILRNLAPDFMNFRTNARKIAKNQVRKAEVLLTIVGTIIGAAAAITIGYLQYQTSNTQSDLRARVTILESRPKINEELNELKQMDLLIQERLEQLEGNITTIKETEQRIE